MKLNSLIFLGLSLVFSGCLPTQQRNSSISAPTTGEEVIVDSGMKPDEKHEIEQFDIEEISEVYYQQIVPVNHFINVNQHPGLLPPSHQKRIDHIKLVLKGLLDGPCPQNADVIFEKLITVIKKRIDDLSIVLVKAVDQQVIEKLRERIEILEELEKKIVEKKEDCANGAASCTDQFKEKIEDLLVDVDILIEDLESQIAEEQSDEKKLELEKSLIRAQSEKIRLQEILSKC